MTYAPGYFMAKARRASAMHPYGWPPRFEPQYQRTVNANGETHSEVATRVREAGLAAGKAHSAGTIPMGRTPKLSKPLEWM